MKNTVASVIRKYSGRGLCYVILIGFLLISILPVYWMVQASIAPPAELRGDPFRIPTTLTLDNLIRAWTIGRMSTYMWNSIYVSVLRVAGVLFFASLAGYGFGKLSFWGRDKLFKFMLFGMMIPLQAVLIPTFFNLSRMGLINNRLGIVIPYLGLSMPFAIFMMRAFFRTLPSEFMDSAKIDGCNEFSTFWHIMLPLIKPACVSLVIFEFMWSWNNYLLPLMVIFDDSMRTLPLGLMFFQGRFAADNTLIASAVTICIVPIIVVYIILQRKFVDGLTSGALKG